MLGMGEGNKDRASLVLQIGGSMTGEDSEEQGDSSGGLKAASEQILKAIDERDKDTLASALKSFFCMCQNMSGRDEDDDSEKDEYDTMF